MIVAIHQPEHLPWIGFFHKASQADVFVLLDNVQYRHKYFQNRNRIRSAQSEGWLTVPVLLKGRHRPLLRDVLINEGDRRWRQKYWKSLALNYRKAPFFADHADFFESVLGRPWECLADLNVVLITYLLRAFRIDARVVRASDLAVGGSGPELVLDIVKQLGADCYLSGISGISGRGRDSEPAFRSIGIDVRYQEFYHPIYPQRYEPFLPCMSAVDVLFNCGQPSAEIVRGIGVQRVEHVFR